VPVISTDGVVLLKTAYESLTSDNDDENYLAVKKFTEVGPPRFAALCTGPFH